MWLTLPLQAAAYLGRLSFKGLNIARIMLRRLALPHPALVACALPARRAFAAAAPPPPPTRHARNLNATSISAKPDFSLKSSASLIEAEQNYSAHNYHPLPVVFSRAQGVHVWDPEGKRYFDFLSAYSSVNQGHSHPAIVAAAVQQMQVLRCSSSSHHSSLSKFCRRSA